MKKYAGINIQYPISRLILEGTKIIETRTYPIPPAYIGKEMVLIETPGKEGKFKARMVGLVTFGESFKYPSERAFYRDSARHCVDRKSPWAWAPDRPKWGWPVLSVRAFNREIPLKRRSGIRYAKDILVPKLALPKPGN